MIKANRLMKDTFVHLYNSQFKVSFMPGGGQPLNFGINHLPTGRNYFQLRGTL
jgi:hypothetical protein